MSIQQSLTSAIESIESAASRIPISKKVGDVITKDGIKVAPSQKDVGGSSPAAPESPTPVPIAPTIPRTSAPAMAAKAEMPDVDKKVTDFANNGQKWVYTDPEKAQEVIAVNNMGNMAAAFDIKKRDNQNDNMTRWSDILRKATMTGIKTGAILVLRSKALDKSAKKYDDKYNIEEVK